MMAIRLSQAMGAGIRFDADRNENGIASTAPTSVPKNAMQTVSRRR